MPSTKRQSIDAYEMHICNIKDLYSENNYTVYHLPWSKQYFPVQYFWSFSEVHGGFFVNHCVHKIKCLSWVLLVLIHVTFPL